MCSVSRQNFTVVNVCGWSSSFAEIMDSCRVCRLCAAECPPKSYISLFSNAGVKQKWCDRFSEVLGVTVSRGDGGSDFMCCRCARRLESIEKAFEDLKQFSEMARSNCCSSGSANKRSREASTPGTSPDASVSRPVVKRVRQTRQRLDFGQGTF